MKIGDKIADFEFEMFHEGEIKKGKLSDYKGKWIVLAFYPADFTFICPTELSELADNYEEFKKLNAEVISFSIDTAYAHKAWHDTSPAIKKVTYPMGSDCTHEICKEFGTHIDKEGVSQRATFIIDPEGVLKAMDIHDNSIGRSAKEILRKLKASKFVAEHRGQVCPASWEPGKETLKPSTKLVGKI